MTNLPRDEKRALELIRRHGRTTPSFQLLEPGMHHWFDDDACVGYVDTGAAWVAAGEPVAPRERVGETAERFLQAAIDAGKRPSFFSVTRDAGEWPVGLRMIEIGREPWWTLSLWDQVRAAHRSIHGQVRRARNAGITVTALTPETVRSDRHLRAELDRLINEWLESRAMPPMEFLVDLHPWSHPEQRLYLVARRRDSIVAFLVAIPIYQRNAWFIEDLIRASDAPNGTTEMLIDAAMQEARARGADELTMGLAPLSSDESWHLVMRKTMNDFYHFEGVRQFKAKLRPTRYESSHLAFPESTSPPIALFDVLDAFAMGRIGSFAFDALRRSPRFSIKALTVALIPWITLMSVCDVERWFPSRGVRNAWVLFDLMLAAGAHRLLRHWDRRLAIALAIAAATDTSLSAWQAISFNLPRARSTTEKVVSLAGIAGPALAATLFVQEIRRQEKVSETRKARDRE